MRTRRQRDHPHEGPAAPGAARERARGLEDDAPAPPPGELSFASHFLTPKAVLCSCGCSDKLSLPGQLQTTVTCSLNFRWLEVDIEVSAGRRALWGTRGGAIPCLSQLPMTVFTPRVHFPTSFFSAGAPRMSLHHSPFLLAFLVFASHLLSFILPQVLEPLSPILCIHSWNPPCLTVTSAS